MLVDSLNFLYFAIGVSFPGSCFYTTGSVKCSPKGYATFLPISTPFEINSSDSMQWSDPKRLPSPYFERMDIETLNSIEPRGELRLAGPRGEYSGGDDDIVVFRNITGPNTFPVSVNASFDGFPVPDSIITMKSSFGWIMIANEKDFRVMNSVPDRAGLTERELLIYDRRSSTWHSTLVLGAETAVRVINDMLAGVVVDQNPGNNYTLRKGYPGIPREESVVVDPLHCQAFVVHLGQQSEVLWIEDSTAYYRVQDSLFTARVADDDFKDRKLILTDPRVEHIHWAFRGGEGTGPK